MKHFAAPVISIMLVLSLGCGSENAGEDVVATFRGGQVTFANIDAAILELPADRRRPAEGDFAKWYEGLARKIALQRIVQIEATREGLDQSPEFLKLEEDLRKRATVAVYLSRMVPRTEPIREEELRAFYNSHRDEFRRVAKRQVFHIFKRFTPDVSVEDLQNQIEQLRQRIVSGEDFETLASAHSDSETRHEGGLLGWVEPGQMSPDLDRIIFSLEVGTVSRPITSKAGVHLFLVPSEQAEVEFTYDEVRFQILNRLRLSRRSEAIERITSDVLPADSFIPGPEELQAILDAGEPESQVIRIGSWSMSLREFLDKLWSAGLTSEVQGAGPQPMMVLDSLKQRELIYLHCQQQGIDADPRVDEQLQKMRTQELVDFALRRRLFAIVGDQEQHLLDHYDSNRKRFGEPLRLQVERLEVPLTAQANNHLARLEQAREALERGETSFSKLAAELGGRIDDLGWLTPGQMAARGGRMAQVVTHLLPGQYSSPYRTEDRLEMIRVIDRREPRIQSFQAVRNRVLTDYLLYYGQEALEEMSQAWLRGAEYELDPRRLEALHQLRLEEVQGLESAPAGSAGEET